MSKGAVLGVAEPGFTALQADSAFDRLNRKIRSFECDECHVKHS